MVRDPGPHRIKAGLPPHPASEGCFSNTQREDETAEQSKKFPLQLSKRGGCFPTQLFWEMDPFGGEEKRNGIFRREIPFHKNVVATVSLVHGTFSVMQERVGGGRLLLPHQPSWLSSNMGINGTTT